MTNRADDFNRANGAIGNPSDGGSAWSEDAGDWDINTNRVFQNDVTNPAICTLEASEPDVEVSVDVLSSSNGAGLVARFSDLSNYIYARLMLGGDDELYLIKRVAGVNTQIGFYSGVVNAGVYKLRCEGNTIKVYEGSTERISVTESDLNTNTKHGIINTGYADFYDTFSITEVGGDVVDLAPIQDISAGTWLPSSGSPAELWEMIDGQQSPDSDYCYTTSAGTMEVKFAPGSTPSIQTGHTLSYRLRGNGTCDAVIKLKQGTTVIAQWTETNVPAVDTDYQHTLDSSPSFSITDYTDLRISVEAVP
jgi:hypothetical protein